MFGVPPNTLPLVIILILRRQQKQKERKKNEYGPHFPAEQFDNQFSGGGGGGVRAPFAAGSPDYISHDFCGGTAPTPVTMPLLQNRACIVST